MTTQPDGYSTNDTLGSLVDEVITSLQGYGLIVDQVCSLVGNITADQTQITIDSGDMLSRGVIEIDHELMYVSRCQNGVATVPAWGRGHKGTGKREHADGSAVYISPTYPRSIVSREVNNTIRSLYPQLFAVKTHSVEVTGYTWQVPVPADADRVVSVEWKYDSIGGWRPLNSWELSHSSDSTDFPTGKCLSLGDSLPPVAQVHVRYAAAPTLLPTEASAFADTGLPTSCRDVVVFGAASRLLPWSDAGRTPVDSVSSDAQDQAKPIGAAISVARELRTLYQTRLAQERMALLARYPVPVHRIR